MRNLIKKLMSKFKKGDRVQITKGRYKGCVGRIIVCIEGKQPIIALNNVRENQSSVGRDLLKKVPASLDTLLVGDVVENKLNNRKVLAIQGDLVWVSYNKFHNECSVIYTKHQLKNHDYTVVSDKEEEDTNRTVDDVLNDLPDEDKEIIEQAME